MRGQWSGFYNGTNSGRMILDIDSDGGKLSGTAYAFDGNPALPSTYIPIVIPGKPQPVNLQGLRPGYFNPSNGQRWAVDAPPSIPGVILPKSINATLVQMGRRMNVSWTTDIGTNGVAVLDLSSADRPSNCRLIKRVKSWEHFKNFVSKLHPDRFVYRGQPVNKRLRTSFHRTHRKDVLRFMEQDIPALHRHLSARSKHFFNLDNGLENGAFYNLVQHHGYPTPLLDWTLSPYVAAFFAFRFAGRPPNNNTTEPVRILVFNKHQWNSWLPPRNVMTFVHPHFSFFEFLSIENERMLPQQALSSVTNVDDIESHIESEELKSGKKFIYAIDLPRGERRKAMRDLSTMNITPGSLFPGFDGACEELKNRWFGYDI